MEPVECCDSSRQGGGTPAAMWQLGQERQVGISQFTTYPVQGIHHIRCWERPQAAGLYEGVLAAVGNVPGVFLCGFGGAVLPGQQ